MLDQGWILRGPDNPLLRRVAVRDEGLPGDVVRELARDADRGVRFLLAVHHPATPPEVMLEMYLTRPSCERGRVPLAPRRSVRRRPVRYCQWHRCGGFSTRNPASRRGRIVRLIAERLISEVAVEEYQGLTGPAAT